MGDSDAIEDAWSRWDDEDLVEFSYMDVATYLKTMALSTAYGVEQADDLEADLRDAIKEAAESLPSMEDLHFYITVKSYNTPNSYFGRIALAKKPE